MNFNWTNQEKSFIFGSNPDISGFSEIKSVYIFDLDYTLIKTKSGKKFPTNKFDWELLYQEIPSCLEKISKSKGIIGIVSNQKGLKTQQQITDWIDKIKAISKFIKLDFVFASIGDDRYRKPMPGSYDYIKSQFEFINWTKISAESKIYYIGDAFGRTKDFSDTDVKYAHNCGFKFKTPEVFFSIPNSDKSGTIEYPILTYFTELEQAKLFEELDTLIKTYKKVLILTIGLPASGKSFIRKELIKKYPQFVYSNNDDVGAKLQSRMLVKKISTEYNFIIDDNTNLNKLAREEKLNQFNDYFKIGLWFDYSMEVCFHLNWMRMYWFGGKLLPKVTYYTLANKFVKSDIETGFDKFIRIDKIFKEFNLNNQIKYYF